MDGEPNALSPLSAPAPLLAQMPEPPYFAVVFSSTRREGDHGYGAMADAMEALARSQPGFLGIDSVRDASGVGITVSYWSSLDAIREWKANADHQIAQRLGRERWYRAYTLRICRVERAYGFDIDAHE